jgi:hypothetical protein
MRNARRITAAAAALAALAALPAAAQADITGNYVGKSVHPAFSFAPDAAPYESKFVMSILHSRLMAIAGIVRMECPETSILDGRLEQLRLPRKGVALSSTGGFVFNQGGIEVRGKVGARSAAGTITAGVADCGVLGVKWAAARHRSL